MLTILIYSGTLQEGIIISINVRNSQRRHCCGIGGKMRVEIFCPVCRAAGIKRKLMEVDSKAVGTIYPYCKGCKKNVEINLKGEKSA